MANLVRTIAANVVEVIQPKVDECHAELDERQEAIVSLIADGLQVMDQRRDENAEFLDQHRDDGVKVLVETRNDAVDVLAETRNNLAESLEEHRDECANYLDLRRDDCVKEIADCTKQLLANSAESNKEVKELSSKFDAMMTFMMQGQVRNPQV
jgi:hypothetical protein